MYVIINTGSEVMKKITIIIMASILGILLVLAGLSTGKVLTSEIDCYQMKENKKVKSINEFKQHENVVLLGDSITEIYPLEEIYTDLPIIKSGMSGYTTNDILEKLNSLLYEYNPSKVIILIGTNDIMEDESEEKIEETINNIKKITKKIKKNRKNTQIYIESIYPVNRSMKKEMVANRTNETIQKINKEVKLYCKENDITYINMYDELTDEEGNFNKKYTYDGLHPNTLGYAKITRILMPYIFEGYEMK